MPRYRDRGFTLIELLVVVAIIGIAASILVPNLISALQKAKQKRTLADMRSTGTSWMSWLTDQVGAAAAGASKVYGVSSHEPVSYPELFGYLHPTTSFFYMQEIPQVDGWNSDFGFAMNPNLINTAVVLICSPGRDRFYEEGPDCIDDTWTVTPFIATDFDQDIVWADGYFVRWPE